MSPRRRSLIYERLLIARSRCRPRRSTEFAVVAYPHPIASAQWHPIIASCRLSRLVDRRSAREASTWRGLPRCKVIAVQAHWDDGAEELAPLIETIRRVHPQARLAFLDWYAPLHIPNPELLQLVDLYIKKQALLDRRRYSKGMPDTNLIDYESKWNAEFRNTRWLTADADQIQQKLFVGWNFATDIHLIHRLSKRPYAKSSRPIDFHCRIHAPADRNSWYTHMRGRAYDATLTACRGPLSAVNAVYSSTKIPQDRYFEELASSKTCFSPFGFGEVCWRDFESALSGAALLKPRMDHLETNPDIYRAGITYEPVDWDFRDLAEKCQQLLQNEDARAQMAVSAAETWQAFLAGGWQRLWNSMLERLEVDPIPVNPLTPR